ncbi:MAG TPA: UbiA family prenyltransferase [Thermoplasmata archaeon]|nr:UbiA family prenyltransferase [Thermoplasmata archaeon]
MRAAFELLRPLNCAITAVAVLVAGFIALGPGLFTTFDPLVLGLAILTAFLFAGAGNALNDYFDAETDRKNHPERPIPSGRIDPADARRLAIALFAAANILAGTISLLKFRPLPLAIVLLATVLMVSYEIRFKAGGLSGNLVVSVLVGFSFLFGGTVTGQLHVLVLVFILATLANTGREIIKDVEDVEGDVDRNTLPKEIGTRQATAIGALFLGGAVGLSWLPWYSGLFNLNYLIIVLAADAVFIYAALSSFRSPKRGQNLVKLGMLIALVSFVAGRL